ncbi:MULTISPECIES: RNA polymerase sigma factor RpoE [Halomonas]|uniref:RNA polymerase sigma factor n=2 Tax=Halomonas TaxID=2745 RepID=A0ABQ0U1M6_9GAMM|nr:MULTISPECIES: RNA polymerase sigma factor RpoE [Halomonas]PSJ21587.1 RNA polymerase sigma factor RpoE [Halomonas sp. ND22Bw]KGE77708.1 RNA polymerase sigma factor RpoE [Halomonas salina]MDR5889462.1 RNA polymerase sigma factor RpoE [Halomonas salina]RAH37028.1 RNA polymerase sigma factor RpoE [Halomonas sp. SL1]WJY06146.1 RNA polymerase sigma factor RpoE [Halomonas halophila]
MSHRETDQQLVERAQKGDTRAFDLLVKKYQHKIIGLIGRYVHDHAEVQDVAQEAFIKAYRALGKFRAESAFYTWMYRIAINTAKNHLVSKGRRPPGSDMDIVDAEVVDHSGRLADIETPEAAMARDELQTAVFEAIEALPDDLRTAITLRELDGLSYEDIANIMDCPVGTVRSRIFRAREAVDQHIRPLVATSRNQETVTE